METMDTLQRRINTAHDLHSLVRTMKVFAAVNIRHLEKAVSSLADAQRTIELGLRVVLSSEARFFGSRHARQPRHGIVIFGTDQGMCGPLNDQIVEHTLQWIEDTEELTLPDAVAVVGSRVETRLLDSPLTPSEVLSTPSSTGGITPLVQDLLVRIERWNTDKRIDSVTVFHCEHESRSGYHPRHFRLLPLDKQWLARIRETEWPTKMAPTFTMPADQLFSALVRQYLFMSLYRACAESMASENASRLAAMRGAEKNIGDRIDDLTGHFHQLRQMTITEELLDIASGFEALADNP
jgi:F-type H+-transporting ATPase subunit gamma